MRKLCFAFGVMSFISYYPLKQGLKQAFLVAAILCVPRIYILLSIKTRIETYNAQSAEPSATGFISYYPLKQGLKRCTHE